MQAAAFASSRNEFMIVDAFDEAALITDHALSPLAANHAYVRIAEEAGVLGESDRPPMMSRLFGADPMLSAPMFRLSKAAQLGQTRREELPGTSAINGKHTRYEACVGPIPGGQVLWRLRELGAHVFEDRADDRDALRLRFRVDANRTKRIELAEPDAIDGDLTQHLDRADLHEATGARRNRTLSQSPRPLCVNDLVLRGLLLAGAA